MLDLDLPVKKSEKELEKLKGQCDVLTYRAIEIIKEIEEVIEKNNQSNKEVEKKNVDQRTGKV